MSCLTRQLVTGEVRIACRNGRRRDGQRRLRSARDGVQFSPCAFTGAHVLERVGQGKVAATENAGRGRKNASILVLFSSPQVSRAPPSSTRPILVPTAPTRSRDVAGCTESNLRVSVTGDRARRDDGVRTFDNNWVGAGESPESFRGGREQRREEESTPEHLVARWMR